MNKKVLMVILTLIFISGCSKQQVFNPDYSVAVIETMGQENKSIISFYDNNFKKVNTKKLPYGSMGDLFYTPITHNNVLYTIPQGLASEKDLGLVIGFDLNTGDIEEYKIDKLAMNSISVNDTSIYTCNTLNGISSINKYEKSSNEVISINIEDIYISELKIHEDKLYAIGQGRSGSEEILSYLYTLDESLNILNKVDISQHGTGQYNAEVIENQLIFSNTMDQMDAPNHTFSILPIGTDKIIDVELKEDYPFQILQYQNKILISHSNLMQGEGNKITIYDLDSKTSEIVEVNHNIIQMQIKEDKLFIIDIENIYEYNIQDNQLVFIKQENIKTTKNSKDYYYISGFFVK